MFPTHTKVEWCRTWLPLRCGLFEMSEALSVAAYKSARHWYILQLPLIF